jgi:hypothetical protein
MSTTETTPTRVPYRGFSQAQSDLEPDVPVNPWKNQPQEDEAPPTTDDPQNEAPEEDLSSEEKTFKQRYGDLRREFNTTLLPELKVLREEVKKLKENKEPAPESQMPETEAELVQWMQKYPDLVRIMQTLARKEARELTRDVEERVRHVEVRERNLTKAEAERKLLELHPDFPQLRDDGDFIAWLDDQPQAVQDWLYRNDTDPYLAARAVEYYKKDKGLTAKAKKATKAEASMAVKPKAKAETPTTGENKPTFSESQVKKMNRREFEKYADAIDQARREGRFVYDLSQRG